MGERAMFLRSAGRVVVCGLCGLLAAAALGAQTSAEDPGLTVLTPASVPGLDRGQLATARGTAAGEQVRYSVQDLDLMQPVAVTLVAAGAAAPVRLEIVKGEWDNVFRSCETDAAGSCEVRFRTQGNFGIKVQSSASSPAGYELAVWVGEEVKAVPANLLGEAAEKGLSPLVLTLGALVLVGLVLVLVWAARSRRVPTAGPAVSLLAVAAGLVVSSVLQQPLAAQGIPSGLLDWGKKVGEEVYKQQYNLEELRKDFEPLSPEDSAQEPQYPLPPGGAVPSRCGGTGKKACEECGFDSALADLQSTRYRLEKLRRVYASTKNMISHSLAVGDSLAGAAGVGGLAWVSERTKILESFKGVQAAYDGKYAELMGLLQESLQDISACEEKVFGEEDWYARFGFMYYEFMAGRYQRAD